MSYHNELAKMRASVKRRENALYVPDSYGFDDPILLVQIRDALDTAIAKAREVKARLIVKLGLDADGNPEAWIIVRSGDELLYVGNAAYTCPPRPPQDCL
jgi:hypothetical protein